MAPLYMYLCDTSWIDRHKLTQNKCRVKGTVTRGLHGRNKEGRNINKKYKHWDEGLMGV